MEEIKLLVTIEGGIIQSIESTVPGVKVLVMDFDTDGYIDRTKVSKEGSAYYGSVWEPDEVKDNVEEVFAFDEKAEIRNQAIQGRDIYIQGVTDGKERERRI